MSPVRKNIDNFNAKNAEMKRKLIVHEEIFAVREMFGKFWIKMQICLLLPEEYPYFGSLGGSIDLFGDFAVHHFFYFGPRILYFLHPFFFCCACFKPRITRC